MIMVEADVSGWASDDEFDEMSDEDILEMAQDDVEELLDKARWRVVRLVGGKPIMVDDEDEPVS